MKKNKKLFAILTLVAFMMTLMPVMAFAADAPTTATVNVTKEEISDAYARLTVKVTLDKAATTSSAYNISVNDGVGTRAVVANGTVTVREGQTTNSTTVDVEKGLETKTLTVAVTPVGNNPAVPAVTTSTGTTQYADPSKEKITEDRWDKYKNDKSNATKFNDFKKAQEDFALRGTDAAKAKVIADCASVGVAEAYFNADTALAALKNNVTVGNLTSYKNAFASITPSQLAAFTGASESTLTAINNTTNLDEVARLVATLPTTGNSGSSTVSGVASVDASIIATADAKASVESEAQAGTIFPTLDTKYAEVDIVLRKANNQAAATAPNGVVYIWAEESGKSKQASDALVVSGPSVNEVVNGKGVWTIVPDPNTTTIKVAFLRAGTYTLKASFDNPIDGVSTALKDVATFKTVTDKTAVTVTSPAQETRKFNVAVTTNNGANIIDSVLADGETTDNFVEVAADTVATTKVTLKVTNKNGNLMTTYPIKLSTNSANIELDKTNITTDYKGEADFNIAGLREGEYKVYVNIGDYEATIKVKVGATSANNIELIKFPSNPIATDTLVEEYANIFRFQLTDANGNIVTGKDPKGAKYAAIAAPESEKSSSDQAKYAAVISAPEANKVKNADLSLKWVDGKDYYTLYVDNNKAFEAEGDYEVRVVLDNGKSVTLNFTVKKFDKAVSLHIEYPTEAVELNSTTDVPDIYFLDANSVMKKANNRVIVAASGYAVAGVVESGKDAGQLTIKNDEKYIGQTVTVTAVSDKENLTASTTLTVADEARSVKLDTTRGQVNANNRVGFKVVDSTGKAVALGNDATVEVTAVVTNTGDADAKVSYSVSGSAKADLKSNGTGIINLSSNKETTATVQIMVKVSKPRTNANDNNTGLSTTYYTGTETFTFGAEADKSVVMTIGSKEIVANNVPATIDVAPFIRDNRTFVPFRALVEAFGAEVAYDEATSTVTTKLDGKTVVLTVGSTVLTVNDETVTMDVAPYIVNDRVVVPVRFVGEAFGFTVEATQDAETGATASVVFYQK